MIDTMINPDICINYLKGDLHEQTSTGLQMLRSKSMESQACFASRHKMGRSPAEGPMVNQEDPEESAEVRNDPARGAAQMGETDI